MLTDVLCQYTVELSELIQLSSFIFCFKQSILVGASGAFAWRGKYSTLNVTCRHLLSGLTHLGSVFRRSATGTKSASENGVGTGSYAYQGFEVGTARISSSNEGMHD